jgi:anti-anti-sigma factor
MAATRPPSKGNDIARRVGPAPRVVREPTELVIWLRGEQDLSTVVSVAETLAEATAAADRDVVVDLSRVEFIDATIVATLVRSRKALRTRSRKLTVRAPSPPARRLLGLCGLLGLVEPLPPLPPIEPIDTAVLDLFTTVPDPWSRTPLGGRAVRAIPRIGRPPRDPPYARA